LLFIPHKANDPAILFVHPVSVIRTF
jgi:hypothetical protein